VGYVASGPVFVKLNYDNLTVGKPYALIVKQEGNAGTPWGKGDQLYFIYHTFTLNTYPCGCMLLSSDGGRTWEKVMYAAEGEADLLFKTYYSQTMETHNLKEAEFSNVRLYLWDVETNEFHGMTTRLTLPSKFYILNFIMPHPGRYEIKVNASKPFVITIPEKYDPLWKINIEDAIHLPILSTINGYYVNKTGLLKIVIEYSLNEPFEIGKKLSITSAFIMIALPLIGKLRRRKMHTKLMD